MKKSILTLEAAVLSVLLGVACGGASSAGPECKAGEMSQPKASGDPCSQTGTQCATSGGMGVAMCDATSSKWGQCTCVLPQSVSMTPATTATTAGTGVASCGNGIVDASLGEQCDGVAGITCAAMLGTGATGLVMCVKCKFDVTMCVAPMAAAPTAGTGATAQAGTGM